MINSREVSGEWKEFSHKELHEFLNIVSGVNFVMLCSSDGFELSLASKRNLDNTGKIAAVSSSILAMVSAFISEIKLTGCQTITLEAENGKVFLTSVDIPQNPMVLVAVTNKDILMGQMLYHFKKLSGSLSTISMKVSDVSKVI
ncbi:MAG: roadblock/LC7 domain-containing protein [Acinetobacter populi]|jgi:predicted regulator of Ras-like GTPase activity (Roadblock/LC7/MglB family)|uniref:roadblock/LC7 domain-containing protein n=1 Tax=Acinetobacter populi TaxID=1582270 RepID=UPI002352DF5B|nr:roadblock/LC7 domain-containing protein [Acinetobacter populi]MCH4247887.1 roadblock/LC7 domain-containing protein [Acinetobacter populi]